MIIRMTEAGTIIFGVPTTVILTVALVEGVSGPVFIVEGSSHLMSVSEE
jgi:hypothetical protein